MRILIISVLYPPIQVGGAEKAAQLLADAFTRSGDRVVVISLHPGSSESLEECGNVRIYRLPMDNLYWPFDAKVRRRRAEKWLWHLGDVWNVKAARRVARILDLEKPDVVHTHNLSGLSISVWKEIKKRHIRLIHTLHDYYMLCPRSNLFHGGHTCETRCLGCRAMTAVSKSFSRTPDAVVSVSDSVLKTHHKYGYFKGVPASVIYNIEPSIGQPIHGVAAGRRLAPDVLVFGFIGKVSQAKGIAMLLQATKYLSREDWRLRIAGIGSGAYVAKLKEQFQNPRIEWLGFTESRSFYASIDVTVVPSLWNDPLPYVVIESLAAGKGIICAESGGLPELALLGKMVGTYPAPDLQALAGLLEKALSNKEDWRSGGFMENDSRKLFMEETVVSKYRDLYTSTNRTIHCRLTLNEATK